jgi:hypothetical protein
MPVSTPLVSPASVPASRTAEPDARDLLKRARAGLRSHRRRLLISSRRTAKRVGGTTVTTMKSAPIPPAVRSRAHIVLPWQPGTRTVRIDRLLLGLQNRTPAADYAQFTGNLRWPSTPVAEGPHAELLRLDAASGSLSDEDILSSSYANMARHCIALRGFFFTATDDAGIVAVARNYIGRHKGETAEGLGQHQSADGAPVRVARIVGSDCFQILDGHHRIASAAVNGTTSVSVKVKWLPVTTPLQNLLEEMTWTAGERQLYQPVDAPELEDSWTPVRRCTDRLEKMQNFLSGRRLGSGTASYLDVASCYGWFPAQMEKLGFDVAGIERDERGPVLASTAYGLEPGRIRVGDAVDFLRDGTQRWDVVSCFSLLHHFALGRASVGPEELLHLLDRRTGAVLFLDTGQEAEEWFSRTLKGWSPEYIGEFLRDHTTFDEVLDLGPDADDVPPYQRNYGRHLFACVRKPVEG